MNGKGGEEGEEGEEGGADEDVGGGDDVSWLLIVLEFLPSS